MIILKNIIARILIRWFSLWHKDIDRGQAILYYKIKFSKYFDSAWYRKHYDCSGFDPCWHYITVGWKKYYNPSPNFSTIRYLLQNPDVRHAEMNPVEHYIKYGVNEPHRKCHMPPLAVGLTQDKLKEFKNIQDNRISSEFDKDTRKLIVYLVPDFDQICGGMMCITNYLNDIKDQPEVKEYSLMLATIPSPNTFIDYTKFDAHAHVYRFEQIRKYFTNLDTLLLHIPEYQFINFLYNISPNDLAWLNNLEHVTVNIMNQNQELMPDPVFVNMLRKIVPQMTMTCAHRRYCNENLRSTYNMPLHFIPADKKIDFLYYPYEKKENLLVLSPDLHPAKDEIVATIEKQFDGIKIVVVENMAFKDYLELIARAKWVLSLGEGFDGYVIESIFSGTISFTLYNDIFFDNDFIPWPNMYENSNRMIETLALRMKELDSPERYNLFLKRLQALCNDEFASHGYVQQLKLYYSGNYTLPYDGIENKREIHIKNKPPVSIIVTIGDEVEYLEEQLDSVFNQTYENIEVLLCEYGNHTENEKELTKILSKYNNIAILQHQPNYIEAQRKLIFEAKGEYVAFCDEKDIWLTNKIFELVKDNDGFDISFGSLRYINKTGAEISGCSYIQRPQNNQAQWYQLQDVLFANPVLGISMLVKTAFARKVIPHDISSIVSIPWWLMLHAVIKPNGAVFIGEEVAKFRDSKKNRLKQTVIEKDYNNKTWSMMNLFLHTVNSTISRKEKKLIRLHMNWLLMQRILNRCSMSSTDYFMLSNHYAFTQGKMLMFGNLVNDIKTVIVDEKDIN